MDVSPCLLFEDIADSETVDNAAGPDHKLHADADDAAAADDQDAESCSCDDACDHHHTPGFDEAFDHDCDEQDSGASNGGGDGDDHGGRPSESCCLSDHVALGCLSREEGEGEEETNLGEISKDDPSKQKEINKDEMEDGLFWETCMAVGYP